MINLIIFCVICMFELSFLIAIHMTIKGTINIPLDQRPYVVYIYLFLSYIFYHLIKYLWENNKELYKETIKKIKFKKKCKNMEVLEYETGEEQYHDVINK